MTAFIFTRIQVGDYGTWRPQFDEDRPRAREFARTQRVFRAVDDPDHVFIVLEFDTTDDARESKRRLLDSGVLNRFTDKHGPEIVEEVR